MGIYRECLCEKLAHLCNINGLFHKMYFCFGFVFCFVFFGGEGGGFTWNICRAKVNFMVGQTINQAKLLKPLYRIILDDYIRLLIL